MTVWYSEGDVANVSKPVESMNSESALSFNPLNTKRICFI
jgi:hypothetical protein